MNSFELIEYRSTPEIDAQYEPEREQLLKQTILISRGQTDTNRIAKSNDYDQLYQDASIHATQYTMSH